MRVVKNVHLGGQIDVISYFNLRLIKTIEFEFDIINCNKMGCHYYEINIQQNKTKKSSHVQIVVNDFNQLSQATLNVTCPMPINVSNIFCKSRCELVAGRLKWRSLSQMKKINC